MEYAAVAMSSASENTDGSQATSPSGTLKPVRRANLPTVIAEQLRRQIAEGEFAPGQQLPGHRDLATIFSVSVGTVREAISVLVSEGLIEARAGWGTFVAESPTSTRAGTAPAAPLGGNSETSDSADAAIVSVNRGISLSPPLERKEIAELIEARETIEVQVVTLAAERATPEQIERLKAALSRMEAAAGHAKDYGDADFDFHSTLAEAADNQFLMNAMVEIRARLKSDIELSLDALIRRFGDVHYSVGQHRRLVEAVERGDVAEARALSLEMMNRNHEFLMSLYGLASPSSAARAGRELDGRGSSDEAGRVERNPLDSAEPV